MHGEIRCSPSLWTLNFNNLSCWQRQAHCYGGCSGDQLFTDWMNIVQKKWLRQLNCLFQLTASCAMWIQDICSRETSIDKHAFPIQRNVRQDMTSQFQKALTFWKATNRINAQAKQSSFWQISRHTGLWQLLFNWIRVVSHLEQGLHIVFWTSHSRLYLIKEVPAVVRVEPLQIYAAWTDRSECYTMIHPFSAVENLLKSCSSYMTTLAKTKLKHV